MTEDKKGDIVNFSQVEEVTQKEEEVDFSQVEELKKKDNSESSESPLSSLSSEGTLQSALSGKNTLGVVQEVEAPQISPSETQDKATQDLLSRATKPLPAEVQPIPIPKQKSVGEIKVVQPQVEQKIKIPDEVKKIDAYHASQKGDYGLSEQILNTIGDDKDGYIYELRAHNQSAKGNFLDAKQNLIQAINLNPNNERLYPELAIASHKAGDTKTATESADRYIKDTGGVAGGDEQRAINLSNIYAIKGDQERSDYWAKNAEGIRQEREKNAKADMLKTFPDWFYSQIAPLNTPEMFISGMEKIKEAENLPQVLSGVVDAGFATLMSSPSGLVFNSVISAGNLVGASEITDWAFAPVSKLLELNGVDESKFNEWGKLGVQVGNLIPAMMFMKAVDLKTTDKSRAISLKETGERLTYKEPLNEVDLKNIDETIATAPKEDVIKTVETIDKFVESKETEEKLKEYQQETTTPTYRVNNELVKTPQQVIEKVTELKEKGVSPDNIEVDVRNDVEGAKLVNDELNKPSVEQKPPEEPMMKEGWQMTKEQFDQQRPPVEGYLYHGSPEGDIKQIDPYTHTKNWREGIGFYTTENREIAERYSKGKTATGERKKLQGKVNYVKPTEGKTFDMDAPVDVEFWDKAKEQMGVDFSIEPKTNAEAYRDIIETYNQDLQTGEGQYTVEDILASEGYVKTTHTEGIKSGKPHKVTIWKSEFALPEIVQPEQVRKQIVEKAINEGKYQRAIEEGKMTYGEVKEIIESAGLKVPDVIKEEPPIEEVKPEIPEEVKTEPLKIEEEIPEFSNEKEYVQWVIEEGKDPEDVYLAYKLELSTKEQIHPWQQDLIDNYNIDRDSFNRFGDRNNVTASIAKGWFARAGENKKNAKIDEISRQLTEQYGAEVSPNDIVDFIMDNPNRYIRKTTDNMVYLDQKFKEIAGMGIAKFERLQREKANKIPGVVKTFFSDRLDVETTTPEEMLRILEQDKEEFSGFPYSENDYKTIKKFITDENRETGSVDRFTGKKATSFEVKKPKNEPKTTASKVEQQPKQEVKVKFQSIADKIRQSKITENLDQPETFGISDTKLWNDALESAAKIIETTGDFAQALSDGLSKLKSEEDKEKFKKFIGSFESEKITGIRLEDTAKMREELGMGEYERTPKSIEQTKTQARTEIEKGYNVENLLKKVEDGTPINVLEQAILGEYVVGLKEKYKGDFSDNALNEQARAIEANELAGSMAGSALGFRRQLFNPEESITNKMIWYKRELGVDNLTEGLKQRAEEYFKKIEELKVKLLEKETEAKKLRNEVDAQKEIDKIKKTSKPKERKTHEEYISERKQYVDLAKAKLEKLRAEMSVTVVPYARELVTISPEVMKYVKSLVEERVYQLSDIIKDVYDKYKGLIPDLKEGDIRDIIAGEYKEPQKPRNEIAIQLQNLKIEAKELNKLDELLGLRPKTEIAKIKTSKWVSETKKRINELRRKQGRGGLSDSEYSDRTKLRAVKTRMNNEIERIKKELASTSPIEKIKREPIKLDKEGLEIKDELIRLRNEERARIMLDKYNSRNMWQKVGHQILNISGVPRAAMATLDLSMMFLQAGVVAVTHPIYWAKGTAGGVRDMFSEKKYLRWVNDIKQDRKFGIAMDVKLRLTDPTDIMISQHEELFSNNLLDKIPFLGKSIKVGKHKVGGLTSASSRAYSSMLNRIRFDMFYDLVDVWESQGKTLQNSPSLYKPTARLLNAITGGADFGKIEPVAKYVSAVLWSPRMYTSQLELLTALVNPYYIWRADPAVKWQIIKDVTKFTTASVSMLGLLKLAGAEVEDDQTSKDFGKVKFGDVRIGLPGGLTQWVILVNQLAKEQTKSTKTGEVREFGTGFGDINGMDVLGRFFRGKLAPIPAIATDLLSGQNFMGEDVTLQKELSNYLVPMSLSNAIETAKFYDTKTAIGVGVVSATGLPTQIYPSTGWASKQTYSFGDKKYNALGEKIDEIDNGMWKYLNERKIDVSPPEKSTVKKYDPKTNKTQGYSKEEYVDFIKLRGDFIKESISETKKDFEENHQIYLDELMKEQNGDGTPKYKDRIIAEKVLLDGYLRFELLNDIRNATLNAKEEMSGEQLTKDEININDMIRAYEKDEPK